MKTVDLRSDTVTRPTPEMRSAMASAEVGDDVYGDDPTVNQLEEFSAELFGFEKALFAASGTQTNLLALLTHCQRGDEYIVGQQAHTYRYEGGGAAVLGSIQPQPIEFAEDGTLDLEMVESKIKPDDFHFARTKLLCLENTQNGRVLPLNYLGEAKSLCAKHNLKLHLDGARLMNGAVKLGVDVREITGHFDSVSICLSKGLGAPVGSVLCGSSTFIDEARRWRKVTGGGMRQAGILAAGALYALHNNIERLSEDHQNAKLLSDNLRGIDQLEVNYVESQTNMVFISMEEHHAAPLTEHLQNNNILVNGAASMRLVTHLDISKEDITYVSGVVADYFSGN